MDRHQLEYQKEVAEDIEEAMRNLTRAMGGANILMQEPPAEMVAVEEHPEEELPTANPNTVELPEEEPPEVDPQTVRRQQAALTERTRTRNLNTAFNRMADLVPAAGRSRLEIITPANTYIVGQNQRIEELQRTNADIVRRMTDLERRYAAAERVLAKLRRGTEAQQGESSGSQKMKEVVKKTWEKMKRKKPDNGNGNNGNNGGRRKK